MQRYNASLLVVSKEFKPSAFQRIRSTIVETATNLGFYASISEIRVCAKHKAVMYSLTVDLCDPDQLYAKDQLQFEGECRVTNLQLKLKDSDLQSVVLSTDVIKLQIGWNKRHV